MKARVVVAVLVGLALVGTAAWSEGSKETAVAGEYGKPGVFPLPKTLTVRGGIWALPYDPASNPIVQMWEKETNVHIDWVIMENDEKRNILFASDDYPEWSFTTGLWQNLITKWLGEELVLDLVPYLKKGYTPNFDRLVARYPDSYAYMLNPKGQLPAMPWLQMLEANYLEQNFMINRAWLDKLGLKVPTTTTELKSVLMEFRDRDPNGNGKKDEFPFAFVALDGFAQHLKALYGIWGLPTKEGVAIRNGKCVFAPVEQGYKDFILYMADLYANGLIDPESFTYGGSNFNAKISNPQGNQYGFIIAPKGYVGTQQHPNRGQFEPMSPPAAPGYGKPQIWVHPGYLAIKNSWIMTDKAKYPEHVMAWIDKMYTFERSIQAWYGPLGQGIVEKNGILVPKTAEELGDPQWQAKNTFRQTLILFEADDYKKFALDPTTQFLYNSYYKYYAEYKATEQWNRPEMSAEETKEMQTLATDINKLWTQKQAEWITGVADVKVEWDGYVQKMKSMGVDRYVEIHQQAHNRYLAAQKK